MGLACAGCARKDERSSMIPNSNGQGVNSVLLEYLEKSRDPSNNVEPTNKLKKSNRLNMAFDSATNYWLNGEGGLFDSTHRTAITYRVDNMSQLMRVHNSIITENEYEAAKKIKDLYFQYKRKKMLRAGDPQTQTKDEGNCN